MTTATSPAQIRVSESALIRRINRKLAPDFERLHVARKWHPEMGWYYVKDSRNIVTAWNLNLEEFGREMGCLSEREKLDDTNN